MDSHGNAKLVNPAMNQENVCPVRDILSRFGDKWSMYTILLLGRKGTLRFSELKANVSGISQRMLTVTLRSLEEDGIVIRQASSGISSRVVYQLSALGESLLEQMQNLALWAKDHCQEIVDARKNYSANVCGKNP